MFILRATFWLSAVILLLPASPDGGSFPPRVGVLEAVRASGELVRDVGAVCKRRPDACEVAGKSVTLIGMKLATGIAILSAAVSGNANPRSPAETDDIATGTLAGPDIEPEFPAPAAE